jgi:hypothetical protein
MNLGVLIAEVPYIACYVLTFSAFAAAGAWRDLRQESSGRNRRAAFWRVATPLIIGAILVAMIAVFFPVKAPPHDAEMLSVRQREKIADPISHPCDDRCALGRIGLMASMECPHF